MHNLRWENTKHFAIGITLICLHAPNVLVAETSTSKALIVVTNASDADWVKRIGRHHVQVETLLKDESGYDSSNRHVRGLKNFQLFVYRGDSSCRREAFWRERIVNANPIGKLHRMSSTRHIQADDCTGMIQRAVELHRVLSTILPQYRASIDANLNSELYRIRTSKQYVQFALSD